MHLLMILVRHVHQCQHAPGMCSQVSFWTVQQLMDVKRDLMPALRRNRSKAATTDAYSAFAQDAQKSAANRLQVST